MERVGASYDGLRLDKAEIEMAKFHLSDENQKFIRCTDRVIKLCWLRLVSLDGSSLKNILDSRLNPHDPPYDWRSSKTLSLIWYLMRCPIGSTILHVYLIYISFKLFLSALISFEYQRCLDFYLQHENSSASRQHLAPHNNIRNRVIHLSELLELIGVPFITMAGVGPLAMTMIGIAQLIYLQGGLVVYRYYWPRIRLDGLGSIYDPIGERRRILRELERVVTSFCDSVMRKAADYNELKLPQQLQITRGIYTASLQHYWDGSRSSIKEGNQLASAAYDLGLTKRSSGDDIEWPVVATVAWQRYCSHLFYNFLAAGRTVISLFIVCGFVLAIFGFELFQQTSERLTRIQQSKSIGQAGGNQNFHLDPIRLSPFLSRVDKDIYEDYGGGIGNFIWLIVFIESKYYFTATRFVFFIEIVAIGLFVTHVFTTNIYITLCNTIGKVAWLNEIIGQLNKFNETVARELEAPVASSGLSESTLLSIKAYLNYELFRRQYPPFRLAENFLLLQVVLFDVVSLVVCYFVLAHLTLTGAGRFIVFSCSACMTVGLNVPLIVSSFKTRRAIKLMWILSYSRASAARAIYQRARSTPQLRVPTDLWRRQSLTEDNCKRFFAGNLFGYDVTYQLVMTINAYFGAIWVLWIKLSH